jgi:hypothetical protein
MLRAIKIEGNKVITGETIAECLENVKKEGLQPPMSSIAGWINEEGTFVTEKPSETVNDIMTNLEINRERVSLNPMMTQTLETPRFNENYFIKPKKGLRLLWDKIMNYKVKL